MVKMPKKALSIELGRRIPIVRKRERDALEHLELQKDWLIALRKRELELRKRGFFDPKKMQKILKAREKALERIGQIQGEAGNLNTQRRAMVKARMRARR